MSLSRVVVPDLANKKFIEVTNKNGVMVYVAVLGKKTPVQWALQVYQCATWGKISAVQKINFIEDAVSNCEKKLTNTTPDDLQEAKEGIDGLGCEAKKDWLNFWSSVEQIREKALLPLKDAVQAKMLELGYLVQEEPVEDAMDDAKDDAMDDAKDDGTSRASTKKRGARMGKKTKPDAEKIINPDAKYWPQKPKSTTALIEVEAFTLPKVSKEGEVVTPTYDNPVSKRVNGILLTGIIPYCPYTMAMSYSDKTPSCTTTPEETKRVAGFETEDQATDHNKRYAEMLQDSQALVFEETAEYTVRQYAAAACTGHIRNRAGSQRQVGADDRDFVSIGKQVGGGLKIVLANRTDSKGNAFRTIEDANTSTTALGGYLSKSRMMPPTMPDVDCIDRNVSQQQLDRLLLKTVTANVLTGDDEDMDEKTGLAKMAKPQPRWAKLDMKEIRNVLVDLGVPAVSWLPDDGGALLTFQQLVSLYTNRRTNQPMGTDKFAQECFAEAKMILEHFHKGSKPTGYGLNPGDWYCHVLQAMILEMLRTGPDGVIDKLDLGRFLFFELFTGILVGSGINALNMTDAGLNDMVLTEKETMGKEFQTTMLQRVQKAVDVFDTLMSYKLSTHQACRLTPVFLEMMRVVDSSKAGKDAEFTTKNFVPACLVSYYTRNPEHLKASFDQEVSAAFFWPIWPKFSQFNVARTPGYVAELNKTANSIYAFSTHPDFTKDPESVVESVKVTAQLQKRKFADVSQE